MKSNLSANEWEQFVAGMCPECDGMGISSFCSLDDDNPIPCPACGWSGRRALPGPGAPEAPFQPAVCLSLESPLMSTLRFAILTVFFAAKAARWIYRRLQLRRDRRIIAARLAELCPTLEN